MGTSISSNINSLNAQEGFRQNSDFQAGVIRRLTSGYRIGRAGDDPAGLTIANRFRADSGEVSQRGRCSARHCIGQELRL